MQSQRNQHELETKYLQNQEKVAFYDKAQQVNASSAELISYITEMKARVMAASAGDYDDGELAVGNTSVRMRMGWILTNWL